MKGCAAMAGTMSGASFWVTIASGRPPLGMKTLIIVVIGVAGSGKTTIGTMLAAAMKCPFLEGDSLPPKRTSTR